MTTLNTLSELNITPSRKRKRQFDEFQQEQERNTVKTTSATTSCFTNDAFSSTPKKILGKRRLHLKTNKENSQIFHNFGLEVKPIVSTTNNGETNRIAQNPYEVLRKPPKKKRHTEVTACFENPALNLDMPEKQFNPYEVVRDGTANKTSNCFSNPALNLKVQDASTIRNPFEVQRNVFNECGNVSVKHQENPILNNPFEISPEVPKRSKIYSPKPCNLKLGIPFVPTVGCRIDFRDISVSQLTPSKLLAEKLVFSPIQKPKVSIGSVGEETTMDIGKELDRYQLELENSINEAKLRKSGTVENALLSPPEISYQIQIADVEKKSKFIQKLSGISEVVEDGEIFEETNEQTEHHTESNVHEEQNCKLLEKNVTPSSNPFKYDLNKTEEDESLQDENLNELYGDTEDGERDENDSFDFKALAPFVRAYTKPDLPKLTVSKESLKSEQKDKSNEADNSSKKSINVKNIIRKSIRKIMHHDQQQVDTDEHLPKKTEVEKQNGFMDTIRQSLRRRPSKKLLEEESVLKECEVSIIDSTERTMKLKSDLIQTEYAKIEDLTYERKHNIRNSLRNSTRKVHNHFIKSVLNKKHVEYDFNK